MSRNNIASRFNHATRPRAKRVFKKAFSIHKVGNLFLNSLSKKVSDFKKTPSAWGLPPAIMIEAASVCNLYCPLCACGAGEVHRKTPFLDVHRFEALINELQKSLWMVLFWNQGEPFLHPSLHAMIRYASDRGIYTITSTNGHFLQDADALIESNLDEVIVSLDGATEDVYQKYRVGGNFQKVLEGISMLVQQRHNKNVNHPHITIQCVISRYNEHQVHALEELSQSLGVDELLFKTMEIIPGAKETDYLPRNLRYRRYPENPETWTRKNDKKNCRELWYQPGLNSDGTVSVCCFDKNAVFNPGEYIPGNFRALWKSPKWMSIRDRVKNKKGDIMPCKKCTATLNLNYRSILFQ
ncbi:MAG: radical SAM protein [Candidatus Marinimicrobia bacterium]|nr:radical SAM protein [Candidatus Neomarinimicrobiota bacterium]MDD5582556.1 radical SAM protein [Candidatus Neomarinimicrobiota bacterium]